MKIYFGTCDTYFETCNTYFETCNTYFGTCSTILVLDNPQNFVTLGYFVYWVFSWALFLNTDCLSYFLKQKNHSIKYQSYSLTAFVKFSSKKNNLRKKNPLPTKYMILADNYFNLACLAHSHSPFLTVQSSGVTHREKVIFESKKVLGIRNLRLSF